LALGLCFCHHRGVAGDVVCVFCHWEVRERVRAEALWRGRRIGDGARRFEKIVLWSWRYPFCG